MTKINIPTAIEYRINEVPEKYKFIETIAKQLSTSEETLQLNYETGVAAYEKLIQNGSKEVVERFAAWVVRQSILQNKV
jgi:hypothetical protein